jgi:hypothetical protein
MKSQYLVAIFFLALILLNYPILQVYNVQETWFDIPVLFFMVFAFWFLVIVLTYLAIRKTSDKNDA